MKHLSVIVLVVFLVSLPSCKFFKGKKLFGRKADTMLVWQARQDSIRVVDSIRKEQEQLMAIEQAKLEAERQAEEERLALESRLKYNIIVGSFITPQYAKDYSELYKLKGYDTKIIPLEGSKFELVSAEAHQNFSTALTRLQQFQDTVDIDAWMYIRK